MSEITDFFTGDGYMAFASAVKWIFGTLAVIFFGIALYAYLKVHLLIKSHHAHSAGHDTKPHPVVDDWRQTTTPQQAQPPSDQATQWEEIKRRGDSLREAEWKLAVIEADNLVDEQLKSRGFAGESMGERLMMINPSDLASLQDLWDAHKLRNLLVHDTNYTVRHDQVLSAISSFEKVLKELGAISS